MEAFAEQVRADQGIADVAVNNAGIGVAGLLLDTPVETWERLIGVNLWGVIHGSRLFAAQMVERHRGGHIVNLASAAAFVPSRVLPAYATTKAAVLMLSECLRAELAEHGIGVTAVCPGLINTPIVGATEYVGRNGGKPDGRREAAMQLYQRRNYGPERVADRILGAVRRNRAVLPVTVEAHALRLVGRLAPGVTRTMARLDFPA
jgi:NAD(P)-dependent dehydrogenase (short-subunit alcohol dehydrogenase family)